MKLFSNHLEKMTILSAILLSKVDEVYSFTANHGIISIQTTYSEEIVKFCKRKQFKSNLRDNGFIELYKQVGYVKVKIVITQ